MRNQFDTLERTTEVDLDGTPIASYLYTGTDWVAQQSAGNGTKMRFDYDSRRRLTREEVAAVGIPAAGETLWSQTATYNQGLLKTVQEVSQPTDVDAGHVLSTSLGYDNRSYHFLHDIAREPEARRLCDNSGQRLILGSSKAAV